MRRWIALLGIILALSSSLEAEKPRDIIDEVIYQTQFTEFRPETLLAMMEVESNTKNIVGDLDLKNKAYGYLQIRQPCIDDVNRVYGYQGVRSAYEIRGSIKLQVKYAIMYLEILSDRFDHDEELYIMAYNLGPTAVQCGKVNSYFKKVRSVRSVIEQGGE